MWLIAGHGSAAGKEYPIFKVSRFSTGDNITDLFQVDGKSGITRAREIKVDALTWSDNVFSKGYRLLSLTDLQSFIEKINICLMFHGLVKIIAACLNR